MQALNERIAEADQRAAKWIGDANEAAEKGQKDKADRLFEKAQFWLDRLNKLRGDN